MPFLNVKYVNNEESVVNESDTKIKNAVKANAEKLVEVPKWKVRRRSIVAQESIDNRTKHIISAVTKAVSTPSLHNRLEDFCGHLFKYPQAKSLASRVSTRS